jgi:uncharacterized protein YegP (UPF0339 family)
LHPPFTVAEGLAMCRRLLSVPFGLVALLVAALVVLTTPAAGALPPAPPTSLSWTAPACDRISASALAIASFTVPPGATTLTVELAGAQGGSGGQVGSVTTIHGGAGGVGSRVNAVFAVRGGDVLSAEVACAGISGDLVTTPGNATSDTGGLGFTKGGSGGIGFYCAGIAGFCVSSGDDGNAGGGGGSSGLWLCRGTGCDGSNAFGLDAGDILLSVAGGGGGGGESACVTASGGTGGLGGNGPATTDTTTSARAGGAGFESTDPTPTPGQGGSPTTPNQAATDGADGDRSVAGVSPGGGGGGAGWGGGRGGANGGADLSLLCHSAPGGGGGASFAAAPDADYDVAPSGVTVAGNGALSGGPNAGSFSAFVTGNPPTTSGPASVTWPVSGSHFMMCVGGTPTPTLVASPDAGLNAALVPLRSGCYEYQGTAHSAPGTHAVMFTATNQWGSTSTTVTVNVVEAPLFGSGDHTTFRLGAAGDFPIVTSGFPDASISVTAGSLPAGVTLTAAGGSYRLSGTPTQSGTFRITLTASNGADPDATQAFTLMVQSPPAFTSPDSGLLLVGVDASFAIVTSGFPEPLVSVTTGALPPGVNLTNSGGGYQLSGLPTQPGRFRFTLTASNGVDPDATQNVEVDVLQPPTITSASNVDFLRGVAGSFTVTTSGVPTVDEIRIVGGTLPTGLQFVDNHDGTATMSGTPTETGLFLLTLEADNLTGGREQRLGLRVGAPPAFTGPDSGAMTLGADHPILLGTSGFPNPDVTVTAGALPPGVTLIRVAGGYELSGTPSQPGTFRFTLTAANDIDPAATQQFTLTVGARSVFTSPASATFTEGVNGTFAVEASGFQAPQIAVASGTTPPGVTFGVDSAGHATISGVPTRSGVFHFTLSASNGVDPLATQEFTLTVTAAAPTPTSTPTSTLGAVTPTPSNGGASSAMPTGTPSLAWTGTSVGRLGAVAVVLLISGGVLSAVRRRRPRH